MFEVAKTVTSEKKGEAILLFLFSSSFFFLLLCWITRFVFLFSFFFKCDACPRQLANVARQFTILAHTHEKKKTPKYDEKRKERKKKRPPSPLSISSGC